MIWAPTPHGGGGQVGWLSGGLGMIWGPSRQCGDDGDDVGMTRTMWERRERWGQHGWGQRRPHGDLLGAMGTMLG